MNRVARLLIACAMSALLTVSCTPSAPAVGSGPDTELPTQQAASPTKDDTLSATMVATPAPAESDAEASTPTLPAPQGTYPSSADPVAVVNETEIARDEFEMQVALAQQYFLRQPGLDASTEAGAQSLGRFREAFLDVLIDQVLIEQAAESLGISVSDEQIEHEIAQMRSDDAEQFDEWLETTGLTPEGFREQLRDEMLTRAVRDTVTADAPREQMQIHVQHILLADQNAAETALARLENGESFAAVARDLSQDIATHNIGGDLGFLPLGIMPPAFEDAALALGSGEMSGIVESETGLHIILVVEHDPSRPVPDQYWPAVQQRVFEDWLASQRQQASIVRVPVRAIP